MKKTHLAYYLVAGLIAAVIGAAIHWARMAPHAPQDNATSNFFSRTFTDVAGNKQAMAQWQGKVLVINFWATWCAPCVDEMPELSALQRELAKDTQIVGIGIDSEKNIRTFNDKLKVAYPLYIGGIDGSELSRTFGNQAGGLPYTVVVGKSGDIVARYTGRLAIDKLRNDLASQIKK